MKRLLPTRRRFLQFSAGALLTGVGTLGYTWRIEPHWVGIVRRDMPIHHLPPGLQDNVLVQISDLHIGPVVDDDFMIAALRGIAEIKPDLIAITGDFMTCRQSEEIDHVDRILRHLPQPTLATVACLGNHDYAHGWSNLTAADALTDRLRGHGIAVLRNERINIAGLNIAGIDDVWSPRFAPQNVIPSLDSTEANLILCHNPDTVDLPVWGGFRGWLLAGHTHGGQCKAPFLTPPLLPVQNRRYTQGYFDLNDGRHLYINPGLGYLQRVRFNVRPEITVFRLRGA